MGDPYVSLASSTGTSIESASKHNLQCKVSTDHLIQWVQTDSNGGESAVSILKKDKMNYTMHKNDIVVVCKGSWRDSEVNIIKAYPSVVSTYANMCQAAQYWLMRVYNNTKNMRDLRQFVHTDRLYHRIEPGADGSTKGELSFFEREQIDNMPQFAIMGVSLGLAYAHPDSGDTVGTVMYGGLKTVMNGPIKANTGQPVMWIFEFEAPLFDSTGRRVFSNRELPNVIEDGLAKIRGETRNVENNLDMKTLDRKRWHGRESANFPGMPGKQNIFLIIPYVRNDDYEENILDRERIFGTYISSAREYEMVDIKLQNQAL